MSLQRLGSIALTCLLSLTTILDARAQAPLDAPYDARTADWEILTPEPGDAPRINGPKIYGARPAKQFVYRIPCQGERPIDFEAEGLPDGLRLDAAKGIITGLTPLEMGTYPVTFRARNTAGSDARGFKIVVGDRLALTPPMGWNSWGGHMLLVSDEVMRAATDLIVNEGLADVGFQYVSIDDCWMRIDPAEFELRRAKFEQNMPGYPFDQVIGPVRDEQGRILPNDRFPDMVAMTDYIHSFGLKAGLYSGPGPQTCQGFAASFGHELLDAQQYAAWGFDLLKYDLCSGRADLTTMQKALPKDAPEILQIPLWYPMTKYLAEQNRDILYNLCQYGLQSPWEWAPGLGIQFWRIGGDLNHNVDQYFVQALRIAKELRDYAKPGQWHDPDFMYIHKIRDFRNKMGPTIEIPLTSNQRYQYVSLWAIVCAPFFFSADVYEINDFTLGLLANAEICNVNQDALGHIAEVVRETDNEVVMVKNLEDGAKVLGLFNRNAGEDLTLNVSWNEIGFSGAHAVRDLWRQKDIGTHADGISVLVSANGCVLLNVK